MIARYIASLLLLCFTVKGYIYSQASRTSHSEKIYIVQLKPNSGANEKDCLLPQYENARVEYSFSSHDTLSFLEIFAEKELPILEADCFFPNLKIIFKNYTYVLSTYCGVIYKFKNNAPYQPSSLKLANDFIFTESLIQYFNNIEKKYFPNNFSEFYETISSHVPSASNLYGHGIEILPSGRKNQTSSPKTITIQSSSLDQNSPPSQASADTKQTTNNLIAAENENVISFPPRLVYLPLISIPSSMPLFKEQIVVPNSSPQVLQPSFQPHFTFEGPIMLTIQEGNSTQNAPIQPIALVALPAPTNPSSDGVPLTKEIEINAENTPQEKQEKNVPHSALTSEKMEAITSASIPLLIQDSTLSKPPLSLLIFASTITKSSAPEAYFTSNITATPPSFIPPPIQIKFNFPIAYQTPREKEILIQKPQETSPKDIDITIPPNPSTNTPTAQGNSKATPNSTTQGNPNATSPRNETTRGTKPPSPTEEDDLEAEEETKINEDAEEGEEEEEVNLDEIENETNEENMEELDKELEEDMEEEIEEDEMEDEDL
ncbi:MAG: hypothetical protein RML72_01785 [Bacteroidia bacterium]|nr:hypothetical protein [Bacteroidia bacterium]MDW8157591.1 hypothetical protein [Bacteroidia bacterium]